jgi:hypothetical protein
MDQRILSILSPILLNRIFELYHLRNTIPTLVSIPYASKKWFSLFVETIFKISQIISFIFATTVLQNSLHDWWRGDSKLLVSIWRSCVAGFCYVSETVEMWCNAAASDCTASRNQNHRRWRIGKKWQVAMFSYVNCSGKIAALFVRWSSTPNSAKLIDRRCVVPLVVIDQNR